MHQNITILPGLDRGRDMEEGFGSEGQSVLLSVLAPVPFVNQPRHSQTGICPKTTICKRHHIPRAAFLEVMCRTDFEGHSLTEGHYMFYEEYKKINLKMKNTSGQATHQFIIIYGACK